MIRLPHLKDLDQRIPGFPNCNSYGMHRSSNPNPQHDDLKTNDNALHQQLCIRFKVDYFDDIHQVKARLEKKIMKPYWLYYPTKLFKPQRASNSYWCKWPATFRFKAKESSTTYGNITGWCSNRWHIN